MNLWEDARVVRGMRAQLEMRRKRLDSGDAALGWKVGFAAPEMLKRLEITGPLVGFLTRRALVHSGANVSLAGWARPVAEPEIASTSAATFRQAPTMPPPKPRSPASRRRSKSSMSQNRPRIRSAS
jgi:2-keto-4-pentenoate hydratase